MRFSIGHLHSLKVDVKILLEVANTELIEILREWAVFKFEDLFVGIRFWGVGLDAHSGLVLGQAVIVIKWIEQYNEWLLQIEVIFDLNYSVGVGGLDSFVLMAWSGSGGDEVLVF